MSTQNRNGFTAIEAMLILVIIVIVGATGWYVWRSTQSANNAYKTSDQTTATGVQSLAACSGPSNTYEGALYKAPGEAYRFCVPDGWKVYWNGDQTSSSLIGNSQNLTYREGVKPVIAKGGGTDGPFPFLVAYNNFDEATFAQEASGFTKTGSIAADGINGDAYYHLTGANDPIGAGLSYLDQGTKQYLYIFRKETKTIEFRYNVAPGAASQVDLIEKVVSTLALGNQSGVSY